MKTVNGAPQFEPVRIDGLDHAEPLNKDLREWAESRRCVKCFYKHGDVCINTKIKFGLGLLNPEKFSCAAFEMKK